MKGSTSTPKVFISYSWSSPQHEKRVVDLAERLSADGVIVVLDKWDLKEGQDKHVFMEQVVSDKKIQKVLVVCDSTYQKKADERKGGVGTETQLISKEVYENTGQEKFIPIVKEYAGDEPCIPSYMASRIFIDLSTEEKFEENYQKLLRNLYDKPLVKRPPLGTTPAYILEDEQQVLPMARRVSEIKRALIDDKKSSSGLISNYLEIFLASLDQFRLSGGAEADFDEKVLESIQKMSVFRDDFIEYVFNVFRFKEEIELEQFKDFFERLLPYLHEPETVNQHTRVDSDNYKFFIYELFLYFTAVLLNLKRYKELAYFIEASYFYRPPHHELIYVGVDHFNNYAESLDAIRKQRLKLNRISLMADLIKERATRSDITFENIKQADLILYYISELSGNRGWFPRTSVYNSRWGSNIDLFDRMISVDHFNRIKVLFGTSSVAELKSKVEKYTEAVENGRKRRLDTWDYEVRPMEEVFNFEKIATVK